jgi:cell division protein FtsB
MASRRTLLWAAAAVALVLAGWSASAEGGFRRYLRLSMDVAGLREKNVKLAAKNAALLREIEALRTSPEMQEQAAREDLGFVRPNEVVFTLEAK